MRNWLPFAGSLLLLLWASQSNHVISQIKDKQRVLCSADGVAQTLKREGEEELVSGYYITCGKKVLVLKWTEWPAKEWGGGPFEGYSKYPAEVINGEVFPLPLTKAQRAELNRLGEEAAKRSRCVMVLGVGCWNKRPYLLPEKPLNSKQKPKE